MRKGRGHSTSFTLTIYPYSVTLILDFDADLTNNNVTGWIHQRTCSNNGFFVRTEKKKRNANINNELLLRTVCVIAIKLLNFCLSSAVNNGLDNKIYTAVCAFNVLLTLRCFLTLSTGEPELR